MTTYSSSLLSAVFVLSMSTLICMANAEEPTVHAPAWNGTRKALTSAEKIVSYLSVGSITCHNPATSNKVEQYFHGTGQLTLSKDIVTTAAHNFVDPTTCRPWAAPWSCEFRTEDGSSYTIDMDSSRFGFSMKSNDWKNQHPGTCRTDSAAFVKDDWAVIKLSREVKDAVPYQILEFKVDDKDIPGKNVVEVAGYTASFLDNGQQTPSREKCFLKGKSPVGGSAEIPLLLSTCGGGPGTSGSGLYIGSDGSPSNSRLIAIYHGPLLGHGMNSSLYVPIAGKLLSQLRALMPQQ